MASSWQAFWAALSSASSALENTSTSHQQTTTINNNTHTRQHITTINNTHTHTPTYNNQQHTHTHQHITINNTHTHQCITFTTININTSLKFLALMNSCNAPLGVFVCIHSCSSQLVNLWSFYLPSSSGQWTSADVFLTDVVSTTVHVRVLVFSWSVHHYEAAPLFPQYLTIVLVVSHVPKLA